MCVCGVRVHENGHVQNQPPKMLHSPQQQMARGWRPGTRQPPESGQVLHTGSSIWQQSQEPPGHTGIGGYWDPLTVVHDESCVHLVSPPANQTRNVKASCVSLMNKEATGGTTSSREVLGPEGGSEGEEEGRGEREKREGGRGEREKRERGRGEREKREGGREGIEGEKGGREWRVGGTERIVRGWDRMGRGAGS